MRTIIFRPDLPATRGAPAFRVNKMGIHENMPPKIIHRPGNNDDFLFMLFHDPACIRTAVATCEYPAGTMMIWEPGRPHYYGSSTRAWDHSWFHCEGAIVEKRLHSTTLPLNRPFSLPDPAVADKYLLAFHSEITGHLHPDAEVQCSLFSLWIREMERQLEGDEPSPLPRRFIDVRRHIESHFHEPIRLRDLAGIACMSVPHFCAGFKRHFGFPAIEYVVQLRVRHAAFLLGDVNMNVTEVAEAVGYEDICYFSKLFKKHLGVSPREYRKKSVRA